MRDIFASAALGAIVLAAFGAVPTLAGSAVTFVSGKGADSGTCASPASPCRTFAYALTQTNANGAIKTLDPANYGKANIAKSVAITGVPGAGIVMSAEGAAITIDNAAAVVSLRGLDLDGRGVGTHGIAVADVKAIKIIDCTIRRFSVDGVSISPAASAALATISNTISSDNGSAGIEFVPGAGASVRASVDHTTTNNNAVGGVLVQSGATVMISDSIADNNAIIGFGAYGATTSKMYLARSVASGNGTGIGGHYAAIVKSFGDSEAIGNGIDVGGAVGAVPSK
jgi:hypothetical protein